MANKKITELTELTAAGSNDVLPIVDLVAVETKKIKVSGLKASLNLQRADVGLSNVDNTADINKPISTSVQAALDLKADSVNVYTKSESDFQFEPKNLNIQTHIGDTNNPHEVNKSQIGLSNVPNVDATQRANHTGTQLASTISDFNSSVNSLLTQGNNVQITYSGTELTISSTDKIIRERNIFGPISVGSNNTVAILNTSSAKINSIMAYCETAPVGSDLIIDILKNGTSIFSTPSDRLTISNGSQNSTVGSFSDLASPGDVFKINVTQIGSSVPGETITIVLEMKHE